jgi:hypothetical protein
MKSNEHGNCLTDRNSKNSNNHSVVNKTDSGNCLLKIFSCVVVVRQLFCVLIINPLITGEIMELIFVESIVSCMEGQI